MKKAIKFIGLASVSAAFALSLTACGNLPTVDPTTTTAADNGGNTTTTDDAGNTTTGDNQGGDNQEEKDERTVEEKLADKLVDSLLEKVYVQLEVNQKSYLPDTFKIDELTTYLNEDGEVVLVGHIVTTSAFEEDHEGVVLEEGQTYVLSKDEAWFKVEKGVLYTYSEATKPWKDYTTKTTYEYSKETFAKLLKSGLLHMINSSSTERLIEMVAAYTGLEPAAVKDMLINYIDQYLGLAEDEDDVEEPVEEALEAVGDAVLTSNEDVLVPGDEEEVDPVATAKAELAALFKELGVTETNDGYEVKLDYSDFLDEFMGQFAEAWELTPNDIIDPEGDGIIDAVLADLTTLKDMSVAEAYEYLVEKYGDELIGEDEEEFTISALLAKYDEVINTQVMPVLKTQIPEETYNMILEYLGIENETLNTEKLILSYLMPHAEEGELPVYPEDSLEAEETEEAAESEGDAEAEGDADAEETAIETIDDYLLAMDDVTLNQLIALLVKMIPGPITAGEDPIGSLIGFVEEIEDAPIAPMVVKLAQGLIGEMADKESLDAEEDDTIEADTDDDSTADADTEDDNATDTDDEDPEIVESPTFEVHDSDASMYLMGSLLTSDPEAFKKAIINVIDYAKDVVVFNYTADKEFNPVSLSYGLNLDIDALMLDLYEPFGGICECEDKTGNEFAIEAIVYFVFDQDELTQDYSTMGLPEVNVPAETVYSSLKDWHKFAKYDEEAGTVTYTNSYESDSVHYIEYTIYSVTGDVIGLELREGQQSYVYLGVIQTVETYADGEPVSTVDYYTNLEVHGIWDAQTNTLTPSTKYVAINEAFYGTWYSSDAATIVIDETGMTDYDKNNYTVVSCTEDTLVVKLFNTYDQTYTLKDGVLTLTGEDSVTFTQEDPADADVEAVEILEKYLGDWVDYYDFDIYYFTVSENSLVDQDGNVFVAISCDEDALVVKDPTNGDSITITVDGDSLTWDGWCLYVRPEALD